MAKAIHSMIRVLDEDRSVRFYRDAFALEVADRLVFDSFTLIYLRNASTSFEVELTVNHGRTAPYELGDGYGHIAFAVEDLDQVHAAMTERNLSPGPLRELMHGGARLARFFFIKDPDGYAIEVLQRGGRFG